MVLPLGGIVFIETHERYCVSPSKDLQEAIDQLIGEDTYYAKVDLELPGRPNKRWQKEPNLESTNA